MFLCNIKQHFQDWGNLYQVGVGIIFGIISVWLWFRDRNKSIKIKELADQTRTLKDLLDVFIVPNLTVQDKIPRQSNVHNIVYDEIEIHITNSGGILYNLMSYRLKNPNMRFLDVNIPILNTNSSIRVDLSTKDKSNIFQLSEELSFSFKEILLKN